MNALRGIETKKFSSPATDFRNSRSAMNALRGIETLVGATNLEFVVTA